ncbi:MAG: hypothetical protein IJS14_10640 [Lentisphaeria bacterium]|nr:hypothetical protein [Lentisphaeria bacterium]
MNHKVTVWAVCAALAATIITGCSCCQADEGAGTSAAAGAAAPATAQPKKAITPDGEVLWVVAEWDACCTPCHGKHGKTCHTAKCWLTKDGKVLCVKPLRKCPKAGKQCPAAEHYKCCGSKQAVMCTEDDPAQCKDGGTHCYAAKVVTPCPVNGAAACSAKEHVDLQEGKKGCSKADAKEAKAPAPDSAMIPLVSGFESDEVFEISSGD